MTLQEPGCITVLMKQPPGLLTWNSFVKNWLVLKSRRGGPVVSLKAMLRWFKSYRGINKSKVWQRKRRHHVSPRWGSGGGGHHRGEQSWGSRMREAERKPQAPSSLFSQHQPYELSSECLHSFIHSVNRHWLLLCASHPAKAGKRGMTLSPFSRSSHF